MRCGSCRFVANCCHICLDWPLKGVKTVKVSLLSFRVCLGRTTESRGQENHFNSGNSFLFLFFASPVCTLCANLSGCLFFYSECEHTNGSLRDAADEQSAVRGADVVRELQLTPAPPHAALHASAQPTFPSRVRALAAPSSSPLMLWSENLLSWQ